MNLLIETLNFMLNEKATYDGTCVKHKGGVFYCSLEDLKYPESWDWLMPVIKKCFSHPLINTLTYKERILESLCRLDIKETFFNCADFIVEVVNKDNKSNE